MKTLFGWSALLCTLFCSVTFAQHKLQLEDGIGHYGIIQPPASPPMWSVPVTTYTFPPYGGQFVIVPPPGVVSNGWLTLGNGSTVAGTHFLGTTDPQALDLRSDNTIRLRLNTNNSIQRDAGGNARGVDANDLQSARALGTQVASGVTAMIGGGSNNTASGLASSVVGGLGNTASGSHSFVGGGSGNSATTFWAVVAGGNGNQATANETFVGSGTSISALGFRSAIVGGGGNTVNVTGSHGFIGGGESNTVSGDHASLVGGSNNQSLGNRSFLGGGLNNISQGFRSVVGGGQDHNAANDYATISGGRQNLTIATGATVGGGEQNSASQTDATVAGGQSNTASAAHSTVGGGQSNDNASTHGTVGGGNNNNISGGLYQTIAGGQNNNSTAGNGTSIGGGNGNATSAHYATVAGGESNSATAQGAFVGSGFSNTASGIRSAIAGGQSNTVSASHAAIGGGESNNAQATHSTIPGGRGLTLSAAATSTFGFLGNNGGGGNNMTIATSNTAVFGNTDLWLANNDNSASQIRLYEANATIGAFPGATNYTAFQAGLQGADITYTLPTTNVNGVLNNTGGILSWLASPVTGSGTQNFIPKWNNLAGTTLGNSLLQDDGAVVTAGGHIAFGAAGYILYNAVGADVRIGDNLVPNNDNLFSLGTDALRWTSLYVTGSSVHIGSALATEMNLGYAGNVGSINVNGGSSEVQIDRALNTVSFDPDGNGTQNVQLNANGVGVGANPSFPLHVVSATNVQQVLDGSSTSGTWISLNNSSVGGRWFNLVNTGSGNGEGPGKLFFNTGSGAATTSAANPSILIDWATSNVGINTSIGATPSEKFHVNGNTRVDGSLLLGPNLWTISNAGAALNVSSANDRVNFLINTDGIGAGEFNLTFNGNAQAAFRVHNRDVKIGDQFGGSLAIREAGGNFDGIIFVDNLNFANRAYHIPNSNVASTNFVVTNHPGTQTISSDIAITGASTLGTGSQTISRVIRTSAAFGAFNIPANGWTTLSWGPIGGLADGDPVFVGVTGAGMSAGTQQYTFSGWTDGTNLHVRFLNPTGAAIAVPATTITWSVIK